MTRREQEIRRRQADKTKQGQAVIPPTVLVGGGVDADGESDGPGEDNGDHGDEDSQQDAVADHCAHRQVVLKRITPVAVKKPADPVGVL